MKNWALSLGLVLALAGGAAAQTGGPQGAPPPRVDGVRVDLASDEAKRVMGDDYDTTVVCTVPDIFECHSWRLPNGKYIQFSFDKRTNQKVGNVPYGGFHVIEGDWWLERMADGHYETCRTLEPGGPHLCDPAPIGGRKVGDKWKKMVLGLNEHFEIVAGHK